jgi:hypothetical protein
LTDRSRAVAQGRRGRPTGAHAANLEWGQSLGAAACFRKPVNIAALRDEVRRCIG